MKPKLLFCRALFLSLLLIAFNVKAQDPVPPIVQPGLPANGAAPLSNQAEPKKIEVVPGAELQGGIGNFGDPATHHGFALTMNGSLGVSSKPNTFGYDAFSVNTRWVPGTSKFGRRIIIQFGAANWFTPALSSVYKDTVLVTVEKSAESQTVNNIMAGLSFQLGKHREVGEFTVTQKNKIDILTRAMFTANNTILRAKAEKDYVNYKWGQILRPALREFSFIVGGMFRLGSLGSETEVTAVDLFSTVAKGKGLFDFVGSFHYLKPLDKELIAKNAQTLNLGFFFDLDDLPPVNTMGLTFGFGKYNYNEKIREVAINSTKTSLTDTPNTFRFDTTLSFAGLFKDLGAFGSSIAFRYSHLNHSSTVDESQFALLLTTKFINSRNK